MKIYVVWYDNGEAWEDGYSSIVALCDTKETAELVMKNHGYTEPDGSHMKKKPQPKPTGTCNCGIDFDNYQEDDMCWACLDESCPFDDYSYYSNDYSFMYIEERNIIDAETM